MKTERKWAFIVDVLFLAVIFLIAYLCVKYAARWLLPFIIAILLSVLLQKPINWILRHTKMGRKFVAPVVTLLLVLLVMSLLVLAGYYMVNSLVAFISTLPTWFSDAAPQISEAFSTRFERLIVALPDEWETTVRDIATSLSSDIQAWLLSLSSSAVGWVATRASAVPFLLVSFIITLVATFFMTSDYERIKRFLVHQIPTRHAGAVAGVWRTFGITVRKMAQSYLLLICITFVELTIGLLLLRVDYAPVVAALTALVDILPVLGVGTILIPWAIISLVMGKVPFGIGMLVLYAIISVVRNILEPKIVGARIGLPPVVTLMAMFVGVQLMGLPGIFLFPLMLILLVKAQEEGIIHLWNNVPKQPPKES